MCSLIVSYHLAVLIPIKIAIRFRFIARVLTRCYLHVTQNFYFHSRIRFLKFEV